MTSVRRSFLLVVSLMAAAVSVATGAPVETSASVLLTTPSRVSAVDRTPMLSLAALAPVSPVATPPRRALPSATAWRWPVAGARTVVARFRAPAKPYGPGHRGIDIAAPPETSVMAPADGVVAFRGIVVDRPVLTITHSDGLVTTFEPLDSSLSPGDHVTRGQEVGRVAHGGHAPDGTVHLGVRLDGMYIDPLTLFGEARRAVLLPCCRA
ncbi:M23 family metallopeptidase [Microbacterium paraoxydans]|uniref:M23 family metallopeptidase n=1 Tax=Microbacterium paraoxydans TaxID=199592 RepID=UPI003D708AE3